MNGDTPLGRRPALSNRPAVTIRLASTADELARCHALRAAVHMGEQHCPYREEFDGDWAKELVRRKGYSKAYLHSRERLWKIMERVDDSAFACDLEVGEDCLTVFTEPMILHRPEDQLDRPGILEQSMDRGASNPHAAWTERRRVN